MPDDLKHFRARLPLLTEPVAGALFLAALVALIVLDQMGVLAR